jgi:hypothetical protein
MTMPVQTAVINAGSAYVKDMTHHAHITIDDTTTVTFKDTVVDETTLLTLATVAANTSKLVSVEIKEPYGRSVTISATTQSGAVTLYGYDYLEQPMQEILTLSTGAATGKKAFKRLDRIVSAVALTGFNILTGAQYGLPFCAVELVREIVGGGAVNDGTITVPDTATPTATTGDVRGTYNPVTAGDGAKDVSVTYVTTNELVGGLYGQAQF